MNDISKLPKWAQEELNLLRSGIKRLSDEEELCAETTGDDPFSMVYLASKINDRESDINQLSTLYSNAIARAEKAEEELRDHARGCQGREYVCTCGYDAQRDWNFDMSKAPRDRIVNVVGRYRDATSGFPRYAGFFEGQWLEYSRWDPEPLVVWAWREREDWPHEPPPPPVRETP